MLLSVHDRLIYFYCYLFMSLPLFLQSDQITASINAETRLIRMLLNETTYLKKVRPSHTVIVDIRLVFNQIISMVEKEQIIVTNCFVDQKWTGEIIYNFVRKDNSSSRSTIGLESSRTSKYNMDSNAFDIRLV